MGHSVVTPQLYFFHRLFLLLSNPHGPIRIGIIGLSYDAWAANAHLPYLQSPKFQIVAICNSSVESAAKSIKDHKLLGEVKAYWDGHDQ